MSVTNTLATVDQYHDIRQSINKIKNDFGDDVSVEAKRKALLKFGEGEVQAANTWTTVWNTAQDNANETFVNRNLIDSVSGASALDTGIGYVLTIEGHTVGDDQTVSSITQVTGTATLTTAAAHGYEANQYVNVTGAVQTGYNGIVKVLTVPTTTTFTYEVAAATVTPATGTVTTNHLNKTFLTQTVQLLGQTRVAITPVARTGRALLAPQNKHQNLNGELYVYENTAIVAGKPTDTTKIHLTMPAFATNLSNNSQKASTSLSSSDYWFVTGYHAGLQEKTVNLIASVKLQYSILGDGWQDCDDPIVLASGNSRSYTFDPYFVIPKNADVRLVANSSAAAKISGGIDGYLAIVT